MEPKKDTSRGSTRSLTNNAVEHWMRIHLYRYDSSRDRTYRIGTWYGKDPHILATQCAASLAKRYAVSQKTPIAIRREVFEFYLGGPSKPCLWATFEIPGNHNRRSIAQAFGVVTRSFQNAFHGH